MQTKYNLLKYVDTRSSQNRKYCRKIVFSATCAQHIHDRFTILLSFESRIYSTAQRAQSRVREMKKKKKKRNFPVENHQQNHQFVFSFIAFEKLTSKQLAERNVLCCCLCLCVLCTASSCGTEKKRLLSLRLIRRGNINSVLV